MGTQEQGKSLLSISLLVPIALLLLQGVSFVCIFILIMCIFSELSSEKNSIIKIPSVTRYRKQTKQFRD